MANRDEMERRYTAIIYLIGLGKTNQEIAEHFSVGEETIKGNLRTLMQRHGAISRAHLVGIAYRKGLIPLVDDALVDVA